MTILVDAKVTFVKEVHDLKRLSPIEHCARCDTTLVRLLQSEKDLLPRFVILAGSVRDVNPLEVKALSSIISILSGNKMDANKGVFESRFS
jgi:hypothetical protein